MLRLELSSWWQKAARVTCTVAVEYCCSEYFTNLEFNVRLIFKGWRRYSLPQLLQRELGCFRFADVTDTEPVFISNSVLNIGNWIQNWECCVWRAGMSGSQEWSKSWFLMLSQFQERNNEKEGTTGTRGVLCSDLSQAVSRSKIGATWTALHEYFEMTSMHFGSVPLQTKPEKCNSVSHNVEVSL